MNSSPCSRLALLATVLLLFASATVVGAVTVGDASAPEEAEVGEEVTATVELESLYQDRDAWTLGAITQLRDTTWTVTEYDESGEEIATYEYEGSPDGDVERVSHPDVSSSRDPAPARITVEVTGTVPEVEQYSYDEPATFDVVRVGQVWDGGETEIDGWTAEHYTTGSADSPGSQEARTALDDARDSIDAAADDGQDVEAAESRWQSGVDAYDEGSFGEAVSLAEEAQAQLEDDAAGSQTNDDSQENGSDAGSESGGADAETDGSNDDASNATTTTEDDGSTLVTLLFYLIGFVVLVAVVGGGLYLRQQREGPGRDPLG